MIPETAVLDANVLVQTWTLDALLTLAERGAFSPAWSPRLLEEAARAIAATRECDPKIATRYLDAMCRAFPFSSWEAVSDEPVPGLPDPNDAHVVHTGAQAEATWIVTWNLHDFPADALAPYGIQAVSPDEFLCALYDRAPAPTSQAIRSLVGVKRRPPRSLEQELDGLLRNGLSSFARRLGGAWGLEPDRD